MVKYSMEAINSLLNTIENVEVQTHFSSLYKLAQQLSYKLRKVNYPIYPDNGY